MVEKMAAVGKEPWPAVSPLASGRVQSRHRRGRAALIGNTLQSTKDSGSKHNRAIPAPCRATRGGIGKSLDSAASGGNFFELVPSGEADPYAVRRPECSLCPLRPCEGPSLRRIKRANPKNISAVS